MVDIKYRMKLTESEISRILSSRSKPEGVFTPLNGREIISKS